MAAKKIQEIQKLRALAVLMVVLGHIPFFHKFIPAPFYQTYTGVDLFFTISGFVVFTSIFKILPKFEAGATIFQRISASTGFLKTFFLRRVFRILPLAVIWALIPLTFLAFLVPEDHEHKISVYQALTEFVSIIAFQYNYAFIHEVVPMKLGYYWSLAVEEHFYLVLPFLLIFIPKNNVRLLFFVGISLSVVFVVRPLVSFDGSKDQVWHWLRFATHNRLDGLFMGVILAMVKLEMPSSEHRFKGLKVAFGLFAIALLWLVPGAYLESAGQMTHLSLIVYTLCSGVLVYLASFDKGYVLNIPGLNGLLVAIGERSYAIYLIHLPALWFSEEIARVTLESTDSILVLCGLWLVVAVVLVELSYRLIELPMMRYGKRFLD